MQFGITCKWTPGHRLVTSPTPAIPPRRRATRISPAFWAATLSPILTGFIVDVTGSFVIALAIGALITLVGAAIFQFMMTSVIEEDELEKYAALAPA